MKLFAKLRKRLFGRSRKQVLEDINDLVDVTLKQRPLAEYYPPMGYDASKLTEDGKKQTWEVSVGPLRVSGRQGDYSYNIPIVVSLQALEIIKDDPDFLPTGFKGPVELIDALGVPKQVMDHIGLFARMGPPTTWLDRAYKLGLRDMKKAMRKKAEEGEL